MSLAVGIDVGAYKCAAAVCRPGEREAERKVLNITTQRAGFAALDAWMVQQGAPVDVVVMESSVAVTLSPRRVRRTNTWLIAPLCSRSSRVPASTASVEFD
jgi:hypothetical protein